MMTSGGDSIPGSIIYHGDIVLFSWDFGDHSIERVYGYIQFTFDSATHTISHFDYASNYSTQDEYEVYENSISLKNFLYDSNGIYSDDHSLANHLVSATYSYSHGRHSWDARGYYLIGGVDPVDLSGIFHPMQLTDFSSVAASPIPSPVSILSIEGSLECHFDASDHSRNLEIYSPLGIKTGDFEIVAGESTLKIPSISSGLYFVRLGESLVKIFVPN